MSLIDKRKMERYALAIPAFLTFNSSQEKEPVEHITRDVSAGGAFFHTYRAIPVGTGVMVDLVLPNRVRIKVGGAVVRSTLNGMAVCFDSKYEIIPSRS
jgi:hypothetical protein